MWQFCFYYVRGTATRLGVFLMDRLPLTAPVIHTKLLFCYLCFRMYIRHEYSANALNKAIYLKVWFCFYNGGTGNLQERTFRLFLADRSSFLILLAGLRALDRWKSCDLDPLTPTFFYWEIKVVTFIHDSVVTVWAYLNSNHFYNLNIKDVRTHSVRFIVCLILVVTKLSIATIKHRLIWYLSAWKVYVCKSLYHVSQAYTSSFYTSLVTQAENNAAAYTPQSYDGDDILSVLSYPHVCTYFLRISGYSCSCVVFPIIF